MMVVRREKKVRSYRGHRTYGYGSHKKHRGGGSKGGRGKAGMHKHKWIYTVKYEPEHFSKHGFKRPRAVVRKPKVINLDELDKLLDELIAKGKKLEVELDKLGYDKLLGKGKITKAVKVKVKVATQKAIEKIKKFWRRTPV